MKGLAEVLRAAADLIEPEGAWTQGEDARDEAGQPVTSCDDKAVCWCLEGAYEKVGGRWADNGWNILQKVIGDGPISWNDDPYRTQAQAVAKLREAADLYDATHSAASLGEGRDG